MYTIIQLRIREDTCFSNNSRRNKEKLVYLYLIFQKGSYKITFCRKEANAIKFYILAYSLLNFLHMNIQLITTKLLDATSNKAKENERLRMNHNIHSRLEDPINRLLNAMEPGTYIRPHRHVNPAKNESCIILRGSLDILIFNDEGNIIYRKTLCRENGNLGIDIPPGYWHGMIINEPETVVYEVKNGPYAPLQEDDFAPWSPQPENVDEVKTFLDSLKK